MKKIMFNDRYGLTKAVLDGHKTMTRRFVPDRMAQLLDVSSKGVLIIPKNSIPDSMTPEQFAEEFAKHPGVITFEKNDVKEVKPATDIREECIKLAPYKVGEIVAIAQRYKDCGYDPNMLQLTFVPQPTIFPDLDPYHPYQGWVELPLKYHKGWNNKMFVHAELMPHKIQITDIKVERLQDINNEDCLKEGVFLDVTAPECYQPFYTFVNSKTKDNTPIGFGNPQYAFQVLIDKLSGFGTWERNDWQFAYTFKLIK